MPLPGCTPNSTFFASSITQTVAYPPANGKEIAPSVTWRSGITCLPPKPAGSRVTVTASVSYVGGCTPGTLELDAITLSNNVGCP